MPDPISSQVAQQAASQAQSAAQPSVERIEIDVNDQSRFDVALNQSDAQPQQNNPHQTEVAANDIQPVEPPTLGDAILNGLENMKTSHDVRSERIEAQMEKSLAKGKDLSVQDCVKMQYEVMQMGLEQELTGKIADKTSQGVQTLFKNQ